MSTLSTLGLDFKNAFEANIRLAIASADPNGNVLLDWGYPEPEYADDFILLMKLDGSQAIATLGTVRSREETMMLDVHFCSWRSDQRQADAAAWSWLQLVARWVRGGLAYGDTTLGGVVRQCFLTSYSAQGFTYTPDRSKGRGCEIIATFTANARVTG